MREVLRADLTYQRPVPWHAWADPSADEAEAIPAQPYVADIEFRQNGDLILGLADRSRDMKWAGDAFGDLLPTKRLSPDRWQVEASASAHYADRVEPSQVPLGAIAAMPGRDAIVATAEFHGAAGGLAWYDNASGRLQGPIDGHEWLYGDTAPIGDIEVLCKPRRHVAYLPMAVRNGCPSPPAVDVLLVLDMSSSMTRPTSDGVPKSGAARRAANALLDGLAVNTPSVRVGVIGFNDRAWVEAPLGNIDAGRAALGRLTLQLAEGTRLDLALDRATAELQGSMGPVDRRVAVVLLTDGLPNHVPPAEDGRVETTVLRSAQRLKAAGATLFTVGLGSPEDLNADLLRAVASDPGRYRSEATAEGLRRRFADLAVVAGCR